MRLENIISKPRKQLSVSYDPSTEAIWTYFNPKGRNCFNLPMLQEMHNFQLDLYKYFKASDMQPKTSIKYLVSASKSNGVYSYGGDLELFSHLINTKNKDYLYKYAETCIKCVYYHAINLNLPITTISLVEGTALGGGFEAAIAGNVLIAEKNTKMGFPEIRFNLFPGMGAYSLLARKTNVKTAEHLISNGAINKAEYLHEVDVVDILAEPSMGIETTKAYMKEKMKLSNGNQGIRDARHRFQPIDYDELIDITKIWVDSALRLNPKDLKMMKKLVALQTNKIGEKRDMLTEETNTKIA